MSGSLSQRAALLLVALAFGATFAFEALPRSGSLTERAGRKGTVDALATRDLQLGNASVPPLRQPRKAAVRVARPVRTVATPAPVAPVPTTEPSAPEPTVTPQPTAAPAPRYVPPAPRPPAPAPTAAPPSGEFDTTGEEP
jgi:hypothetical protein